LTPIPLAAEPARLTVLVYNNAGIRPNALRKSLQVAQSLFERARVPTEWRAVGAEAPPSRCSLMLRILNGHSRLPDAAEAFGAAMIPGPGERAYLADIFYGNVQEALARQTIETAILLGHVMAHEVGHLLLGRGHSEDTIMRRTWDKRVFELMSVSQLTFSRTEAAQLRSAVALRLTK